MPERWHMATHHDAVERPMAVVHPCKSLPLPSTSPSSVAGSVSRAQTDVCISIPSQQPCRSGTSTATTEIYDVPQYGQEVEVHDEDDIVIHLSSDSSDSFDWHLSLELSPPRHRPRTELLGNAVYDSGVTESRSSRRPTNRRQEATGI